jgi:hypothetical protein
MENHKSIWRELAASRKNIRFHPRLESVRKPVQEYLAIVIQQTKRKAKAEIRNPLQDKQPVSNHWSVSINAWLLDLWRIQIFSVADGIDFPPAVVVRVGDEAIRDCGLHKFKCSFGRWSCSYRLRCGLTWRPRHECLLR